MLTIRPTHNAVEQCAAVRLDTFDLNLLRVFDALMRTRNVTAAGEKIGLSQSATSYSLQRLRQAFKDPLFVRTPRGMEPSALALEMEQPVRAALEQLRATVEDRQRFDPRVSARTFTILMSDMAQHVHLPRLMAMLRKSAPNISIVNVALPLRQAGEAMANGEIDLAVGLLPDLGAGFHRRALFSEKWVCVVSRQHPRIKDKLSVEQYLEAVHASFRPAIAAHSRLDEALERHLKKAVKRRIRLVVPYLSGLASIVAATDLVLTLPLGMAATMTKVANVRIFDFPIDLPAFDLTIQWPERVHRDAGHQWLRDTLTKIYRTKPKP
jgi:DNA-binding transcriptional LysR family regulator